MTRRHRLNPILVALLMFLGAAVLFLAGATLYRHVLLSAAPKPWVPPGWIGPSAPPPSHP